MTASCINDEEKNGSTEAGAMLLLASSFLDTFSGSGGNVGSCTIDIGSSQICTFYSGTGHNANIVEANCSGTFSTSTCPPIGITDNGYCQTGTGTPDQQEIYFYSFSPGYPTDFCNNAPDGNWIPLL